MSEAPLRLVVLTGSVREGRVGPTVAHWIGRRAEEDGRFEVERIDLAEFPLPLVMPGWGATGDAETVRNEKEIARRLDAADAVVVVTPEYNHSFPAALKNAIDWFREEWATKAVALVSYGGKSGGIRAAEQLRQVFPELHAVTVRDALSFAGAGDAFDAEGRPRDPDAGAAAGAMLGQLAWWAETLRDGRSRRAYA